MRDHAAEAVQMVADARRSDLDTDRKLNLALVRLVEIVGMRNRIIHGYDSVDILWDVIKHDLPDLISQLDGILASM